MNENYGYLVWCIYYHYYYCPYYVSLYRAYLHTSSFRWTWPSLVNCSRGVSCDIWFGLIDDPASFSSWDSVFRFVYFLKGKSCSGEIGCFLCSSYSWIDFPVFHDFDSIATRIIHFQNCHTDHFFKPFKSKFTNYIFIFVYFVTFAYRKKILTVCSNRHHSTRQDWS